MLSGLQRRRRSEAVKKIGIGLYHYETDGIRSSVCLPDGRRVYSFPHVTADYEVRARSLGYADGAAMSIEHDAIHAALATVMGTVSPALQAVADRRAADCGFEEDLVKIIALRLNDQAADALPGGGFVRWLRELLRAQR